MPTAKNLLPSAYYIVPFRRALIPLTNMFPERELTIRDFYPAIITGGGDFREIEIRGQRALVRVWTDASTHSALTAVYKRLPKARLTDTLADLTNPQKNAVRNELLDEGFTNAEINAAFGADIGTRTLGDVMRFMARNRRKPQYDSGTDTISDSAEIVDTSADLDVIDNL